MIAFDNVAYNYGGEAVLQNVSVEIAPGSFYFLTGPSGSGKTTLLKLCYAALRPTAGNLQVFGAPINPADRHGTAMIRRRIGVVHQDCQFLDHLSIEENIALPIAVTGQPVPERDQNLTELMNWVGLTGRAHALPAELSGGERQRAALARAVIMSPDIILADEPTGNVDWDMSQRLLRLLIELNKLGKTIVIATHDLGLIRAAKAEVQARVLRIANKTVQSAGANL